MQLIIIILLVIFSFKSWASDENTSNILCYYADNDVDIAQYHEYFLEGRIKRFFLEHQTYNYDYDNRKDGWMRIYDSDNALNLEEVVTNWGMADGSITYGQECTFNRNNVEEFQPLIPNHNNTKLLCLRQAEHDFNYCVANVSIFAVTGVSVCGNFVIPVAKRACNAVVAIGTTLGTLWCNEVYSDSKYYCEANLGGF